MNDIIKTTQDAGVATIAIDRGEAGNMLTVDLLRELSAAFRSAATSDAKVITLRTAGGDFCRGRDPKGGKPSPTALAMRENVVTPILEVYDAIAGTPQPIVCAVQGAALGFGCALATACDITIAADGARFRLPEMEKDLPPTLAISAMMSCVPRKGLTWLVYSMEEIDADTALRLGIVSRVVPAAELGSATDRLITELTGRSREALAAVKEYMRVAPSMEPRGAADYGASLLAAVLSSAKR
ncbi:MAG: enoyl-CoA hydratase/isomerase family protein [Alphaproteobacteria bacterium]|nr:enoyl-CoA hydratase/isomerase family protein [Alphaproteobacteria bacterium]